MEKRGIGRALFRAAAFVVLVCVPIGVFASQPPAPSPASQAQTAIARAHANCAAAAAPFSHLFPPVDRPTRARADRACEALARSEDPAVVQEASAAAGALIRHETDLSQHMVAVLVICGLGAFLAVCGVGVGGALYGAAAIGVACWGGVHVWPALVGVGTVLLALPCTPWPSTPTDERVPAPGPAAMITALVGAAWALPALAFVGGGLLHHAAPAPGQHVTLPPELEVLASELVGGAACALVVVPAFVHFLRARGPTGRGTAAKLGLTIAGVVAILAGALIGYALAIDRGSP